MATIFEDPIVDNVYDPLLENSKKREIKFLRIYVISGLLSSLFILFAIMFGIYFGLNRFIISPSLGNYSTVLNQIESLADLKQIESLANLNQFESTDLDLNKGEYLADLNKFKSLADLNKIDNADVEQHEFIDDNLADNLKKPVIVRYKSYQRYNKTLIDNLINKTSTKQASKKVSRFRLFTTTSQLLNTTTTSQLLNTTTFLNTTTTSKFLNTTTSTMNNIIQKQLFPDSTVWEWNSNNIILDSFRIRNDHIAPLQYSEITTKDWGVSNYLYYEFNQSSNESEKLQRPWAWQPSLTFNNTYMKWEWTVSPNQLGSWVWFLSCVSNTNITYFDWIVDNTYNNQMSFSVSKPIEPNQTITMIWSTYDKNSYTWFWRITLTGGDNNYKWF